MPRRNHRRNEADRSAGVVYRAAEEDAEALFGPGGGSIFLRPSALLVKFFLLVEIVTAALITLMVIFVLAQAVCVYMLPQVPDYAPTQPHIKWRLPYPHITPCDPARGNHTVCSTTAFTPGPSSPLEYAAPSAAMGTTIAVTVCLGAVLVLAALRVLSQRTTVTLPGAIGLILALPVFPVSSWLVEAVPAGVFRFLRSGYGAAETSNVPPTARGAPYTEDPLPAPAADHVPSWAWLDKLLLITAHPGLLLLRARGEFTVAGDTDDAVAAGSVFRRVPRAAAEVIGRVVAGAGFQWVLAFNAVASRRSRLFTPVLFAAAAAVFGIAAAFFVGLTHGDLVAARSDALDRWAAAVAAVPSVITNTSALARGSVVPLYTGWAPLSFTAQETLPVFIRPAVVTSGLCAAVVFLVFSLQASAATWQLWVARHTAQIHDMAMFGGFVVTLAAFSQIADPTPTVLPYAVAYDTAYGPAGIKNAMDDLRGLAGLWSCATRGANLTRLPFDRVAFTALHPAAASPIYRTAPGHPNGTAFPSVTAASRDAFLTAAANPAVFTSVPWGMTWPTAVALLCGMVPGALSALISCARAGYMSIKEVWTKPGSSVAKRIVGTVGSLLFSILVIPRTVMFFGLLSLMLLAPCLSLMFHFGIMSPMARDTHLPFAALAQGLCDEAGKWARRRCAVVVDQGTAAMQVFKTLCDAAQPPPPATVSDGLADTADVEEWIGAARCADSTLHRAVPFDVDTSDDEDQEARDDGPAASTAGLTDPLLTAVPIGPRRISEMSQRERRALIAAEQARLGTAFAALEERYFSLPAAERSLFAVVDFFDLADTHLAEDFALFWVTHRTTVAGCVTDAIAAERDERAAIAGGAQRAPRKAIQLFRQEPQVDDDDDGEPTAADLSPAVNHGGSGAQRGEEEEDADASAVDSRVEQGARDKAAELTKAAHAADLFKHFNPRARRDFEDYCKRRVAFTVRWQHRNFPTEQMRYDAAIAHTAAVVDVGRSLQREPTLWAEVGRLSEATVADPTPAVPDPGRTVTSSFIATSGPDLFRIYVATADCAPLPDTEHVFGGTGERLTNPVAWVDEASFGGRVPFFALASSIRSVMSFVKARRWLIHRGSSGGTARRVGEVDSDETYLPPFLVLSTIGRVLFFLVTLADVPLMLLTCRRTTSTWSMHRMFGGSVTDCVHWSSPDKPFMWFTQVGATTEHSTECVPPLALVLYGLRVACLLVLLCLYPALRRLFTRGFLWSLAGSGVPSGPAPPAPWASAPVVDAIPETSELRVGAARHVMDAAALEHVLSHPASDALQLAVECVVDAVAPHPAVTLLTEIPHRVVPLALTARIISPFLPSSSLLL